MRAIFTALRLRYLANPTLKLKGRELLLGLNEQEKVNVTRPWTEVNLSQTGNYNTFDTDVDQWKCEFKYHAKDLRTTAAHDWQEAMRTAFKDCSLTSAEFTTCGMTMGPMEGPSENDGSYDAKVTFDLIVQRRIRNPVTVGT